MKISPKYRCCNPDCKTVFTTPRPDGVECKVCGSRYVEFVNFDEWRAAWYRADPSKSPF